jgi:hypothetical protein
MSEQRSRERPEPLLHPFATFQRDRGLTSLQCRVCGVEIGRVQPVGTQRVRRARNQTIIETMMQFAYLANYREIAVRTESGGRYVGNACAECADKVQNDPEVRGRWFESELKQFRALGKTLSDRDDDRPTAVLEVADYIKE